MTTLFGKDRFQYTGQVKKYTALFGSLFSDLYVVRKSDTKSDMIRVPIKYGPGHIRNKHEAVNEGVRANLVYPAMAFELQAIRKDLSRMTNQYTKVRRGTPEPGDFREKFAKSPVPYDIEFKLGIRTLNVEDLLMILEQIVAVFNPQVTVNIIDNNSLGLERDVTIKLLSDAYEIMDNYESSMDETRFIEVSLDFAVKGYMYKYEELAPVLIGVTFDPEGRDGGFTDVQGDNTDYLKAGQYDVISSLLSKNGS